MKNNKLKRYYNLIYKYLKIEKIEIAEQKFVYGVIINILVAALSRIAALISAIISARLLGKVFYGQLGVINNTITLVSILSGLGLGITTIKYVSEYKDKDIDKVSRIISFSLLASLFSGIVVSLIIVIFSNYISSNLIGDPNFKKYIEISMIMVITGNFVSTQNGVIIGLELYKQLAKASIINSLALVILQPLLIYKFKLDGAIYSMIICSIINVLNNINILRAGFKKNHIKISKNNIFEGKIILYRFSLPLLLSSIITSVPVWLINARIASSTNGFSELGIFNAANQWKSLILFLPNTISQLIIPIITQKYEKKDTHSLYKITNKSSFLLICIIVPISLIIVIFSKWIMSRYGLSFKNSFNILILVVITSSILAIINPYEQIIVASDNIWGGFVTNCIWATLFIIFNFMTKERSAKTLAFSYLYSYIIHAIITFLYVKNIIKRVKETL